MTRSRRRAASSIAAVAGGLLAAVAWPGPTRADDGPAAPQGPRLHVARKTVDFGELIQGRSTTVEVPIENRGDAPLTIGRIEVSCGCTVTSLPDGPIPPGGRATLSLRYDSADKLGAQSVQVLLYSDDPTQGDFGRFCTRLLLQGEVRSLYRANPVGLFFGEVVRGTEAVERRVVLTGTAEARHGFTARLAEPLPGFYRVRLEPTPPAKPGGKPAGLTVVVTLAPDAPRGELNHQVVLETDVPEQPRLRLPCVGIVTGRIVGPDAVHFLRLPRETGAERVVPIERRDDRQGLEVVRVEADGRLVAATVEPVSAQRVDLRLRVPPGAPPGPFATRVRLVLADPDQPVLDVPVYGEVLPRVQVEPPLLRLRGGAGEAVVRGGPVLGWTVAPADAPVEVELARAGDATAVRVRATGPLPAGAALVLTTEVPGEERVELPLEAPAARPPRSGS